MAVRPIYRKRHPPAGARPGTLVLPEGSPPPVIQVCEYSANSCADWRVAEPEELRSLLATPERKFWIDVQGLGDEGVLRKLADVFGLHVLTLEDVTNAPSRPKTELHEGYQVFIMRMLRFCPQTDALIIEQVSVIWGTNYVLTMQEKSGDILDPIRHRLREGTGRPIRVEGPDYLAYAIVDCIIDGFYPVLENYAEWIESLEAEAISNPKPQILEEINTLRRELSSVRRAVMPQRDAVDQLVRRESPYVSRSVQVFLRDTSDHCRQVADVVESYRDYANGLVNTWLSCVSHRANEVMKMLTIMASIFIPLTFLAGIYGMNFEWMPELKVWWAYPATLCVMALTAAGLLLHFRRRGWLGDHADRSKDRQDGS